MLKIRVSSLLYIFCDEFDTAKQNIEVKLDFYISFVNSKKRGHNFLSICFTSIFNSNILNHELIWFKMFLK